MPEHETSTNGEAAAAILAAGIGSLALGFVTAVTEVAGSLRSMLVFYRPAGPLSGRAILAVVVWLASWLILHFLWKSRQVDFAKIYFWTLVLVVLGLVGAFPPPFEELGNLLRCMRGAPAGQAGLQDPSSTC